MNQHLTLILINFKFFKEPQNNKNEIPLVAKIQKGQKRPFEIYISW